MIMERGAVTKLYKVRLVSTSTGSVGDCWYLAFTCQGGVEVTT